MRALKAYIRVVDAVNYRIGRVVMYGIFVMMGILLWSSVSKTFFLPSLWTLEMAQFAMVAYYILGGPYSLQMGSNVRMDLLYGEWTPRRKAMVDCLTVLFLIFYLGVLLKGGIDSTEYSFKYGGERSPSAWRPYMWPIKVIMCIGIFLMLLQAVSELAKDILRLCGQWEFEGDAPQEERADAL
ncbi:TRAP transporter small permease subunit [Litorivita sp. NS0012-18]|uniref:TRAP transporter small permease subunit n=1 Tax=Litorivita sp. NS0012-18 TaxID=3127655 RepID=UPI003109307D